MAENLREAAVLTVLGVLVVFFSLLILMVAIIVLSRVTSRKSASVAAADAGGGSRQGERPNPAKESIAAIAVSLAHTMSEAESTPRRQPTRLLPPTTGSGWARVGREQLMRSRGKVGHQWGRPSR